MSVMVAQDSDRIKLHVQIWKISNFR